MTYSWPDRYLHLPIEVLRDACRPDKPHQELFLSYCLLLALAWQNKYKETRKLREEEMYNTKNPDGSTKFGYLKIGRREYFTRKREMELVGWLRSSHPATGFVQFTFPAAIAAALEDASAETRTEVHENAPSELRGGGESLDLNLNTESPPPIKSNGSAQNCTFPSVVEILSHTDLLFDGSVVVSKGLEHCIPRDVLAWCAYAYYQFQRQRLARPAGLVRQRLLDGESPSEKMRGGWQEILPADFLEAAGLVEYACEVIGCSRPFETRAALEAHRKADHPLPHLCEHCGNQFVTRELLQAHLDTEHPEPSMAPYITDESVTPALVQAWDAVLAQLQQDMPRASFETWVQHTQPVRFHGNVLSIGVGNGYARDWLESRLTATVQRLLVGILAQTVTVTFVAPGGGGQP